MQFPTFRFLRELAAREQVTLRVRGGCMEPHVAEGSDVVVRRRRVYLPGDVVVFRTPAGDLAAHRVLGYRLGSLVTKGDGCELHDAPVRGEAIVGAVAGLRIPLAARAAAVGTLARIAVRRLAG